MKILCTSYEYPPIGGGGANVAHPLAAELVERGHSVDVVTIGMRDLAQQETMDAVDVHRIRCIRRHRHYTTTAELSTYLLPAYRYALTLCREREYQINHTHFAIPSGIVSYFLKRKTGLPYVITIHGSDVPGYNPDRFRIAHMLVQPVWRKVLENASSVVSASGFLKNLIQTRIDIPVDVIPNGYEPGSFGGGELQKQNRILVVTRMFERKGVQFFLDALAGLKLDWDVIIAGDGPYLPVLRERAKRNNLNVEFVGFVSGKALEHLYLSSKVFVFPSIQENFPVVLLEAMQAGCAVITTSAPGCHEVIGDAGITTTPGRADSLRHALLSLVNDSDRIEEFGRKGKQRVTRFQWSRIAKAYEGVFVR